jgi:dolichol-phosphate mannosyltransferase
MYKYLIFIPVYNEENSLKDIISELESYYDIADILVIDDGSNDQTQQLMHQMPDINKIYHRNNKGYGATLLEGFRYAIDHQYHYVITIDSDKQHQPSEIENFLEVNEKERFDIISGSRYLVTSESHDKKAPEDRRKVNRRITHQINQITGYQLTDTFCGFKLYRVDALKKLNITEPGYGMPLQLWIQAWKNGLTVKEIPVELIYFERDVRVGTSLKNVWRRYRYYLEIIKKELEIYENISSRSASG